MAIKSKEPSKYYIEQIILTNEYNPGTWIEDKNNIPEALFQSICKHDKLIGFLFSVKESVKFGVPTRVLNLYLIKPNYYDGPTVSLQELYDAWVDFSSRVIHETHHSKMIVFKNPPIEQWIDTKENWCKKLATKIAEQFNWTFAEALSEVYYTVMKCYNKGHVYMGNLGYLQTAAYNNVRMTIRYNKNRLNQDSGRCESLEQVIGESDDGEAITLLDCLGVEDEQFKNLDREQFEKQCKDLLLKSFSEREIDQILKQKAGYLPMNLYRRLNTWRKQHSPSELSL